MFDLGNYKVKDAISSKEDINYYINSLDNNLFFSSDRKSIKIWEY